ncbi:hypothetical protein N7445_008145 [Penicillium cf. griseofulvum]|nr:hypothetical protein N7445_008145 [Penicillium cf. griseofulvum]
MELSTILFAHPLAFLGGATLIVLSIRRWIQYYKSWVNVPVVGGQGIFESWRAARRWGRLAPQLLQEGYGLHGDFAFQVATPTGWDVCICNDAMIREYLNAPDEYLSSIAPIQGFFQSKFTAPGLFHKIPSSIMSKALTWSRNRTRSSDQYFPNFIKQLEYSFEREVNDHMNLDGWNPLDCYTIARRLTMGLVAKLLIGDGCRNSANIDLFCDYTAEIIIGGPYIRRFPEFLKPRKIKSDEMAKEGKQPEDLTDWLWRWSQDGNNGHSELDIAQLLAANTFGASFNTTVVLVQCLCELATRTEYVDLIRQEVILTLKTHDDIWTKEGIESMKKLDSFIKECHRFNCFDHAGTPRVVKKDFQFKNGLRIPKGTVLLTPNAAMLFDEAYIKNPLEFDGLRFYDLAKSSETPEVFKYTSTSPHYLQFGDGKHVCPGRFFAADEVRLILAYLLFHFDIKLQGSLPKDFKIKRHNLADLGVNILLKKIER